MHNLQYNLFKFSLLILFLQSMFAWFLWGQLVFALVLAVCLSILFAFSSVDVISYKESNLITILLLVIIQIYVVRDLNLNALISALLRIVIISIVFLLKDQIKIDLFNFFTKAFAVLLSISLFAWILFLLGISLPHSFTDYNAGQYRFDNYFFFLKNLSQFERVPRFSSVFLEPGQLGIVTSFFLYGNRFEIKRKAILIIFIATLFTFSLAAYVLSLFAAFAFMLLKTKKPVFYIVSLMGILFAGHHFFINLNNGDNIVNNLIIERLYIDGGNLVGYNRFSLDMDNYFYNFVQTYDVFTGVGAEKYQMFFLGANAGYKVFILQYGIIGTLTVFLFYLSVVLNYKSILSTTFFLVYIFCFIQAAYPLWECELLIFITAMPIINSISEKLDSSGNPVFNEKV